MNDKQQLAAMGAEQPMCLQKRVEQLEALLREVAPCVTFMINRIGDSDTLRNAAQLADRIDEALDGAQPLANPPRVRKSGGSFQHTGSVVSSFKTLAGEPRIVLEFDAPVGGMLHIYRPDQVEPL